VTTPERPADEPDDATPVLDGFEEAVNRLLDAKPESDTASKEMRQRIRERSGDEPPMRSGRPRK
jgi:hypothetical protein